MRPPSFEFDSPRKSKAKASTTRWQDEARFIKAWLDNPATTGAVSPSGRALSRTMARFVDPDTPGPVIELGPGTGPVTEALIRRGVSADRLVLVEFDPVFCKLLARRFPGCRVIEGDAYALDRTLGHLMEEPAAAIVSSLPLLNRPERERLRLLGDAFRLMHPDAPFVQFTYGLLSPIPKHGAPSPIPFESKVSPPVWLNLPPARVWVYRAAKGPEADAARRKIALLNKLKAGGEKLGVEWREQRDKLRAEFLVRSVEARAELRTHTERVKTGLERHGARIKAARSAKVSRHDHAMDKRPRR